jgi:hypothetical protein
MSTDTGYNYRGLALCSKCSEPRMPQTSGRLTSQQVRDIRCLYSYGAMTRSRLCELFGLNRRTLPLILSNKTWQDATYHPITIEQFQERRKAFLAKENK